MVFCYVFLCFLDVSGYFLSLTTLEGFEPGLRLSKRSYFLVLFLAVA